MYSIIKLWFPTNGLKTQQVHNFIEYLNAFIHLHGIPFHRTNKPEKFYVKYLS